MSRAHPWAKTNRVFRQGTNHIAVGVVVMLMCGVMRSTSALAAIGGRKFAIGCLLSRRHRPMVGFKMRSRCDRIQRRGTSRAS